VLLDQVVLLPVVLVLVGCMVEVVLEQTQYFQLTVVNRVPTEQFVSSGVQDEHIHQLTQQIW
jgi:hypothetical protein